ncbi:MAG TPA: hypothetical protein PLP30_08055 [Clostridia bacterium]|nr:hypothetical protein [Clostridia bacterium]HPQ47305.1 hypothetical protein [Clostridia bacterium]
MTSTIKKDFKDGIRNYRFLIIFAGFMFFALLTPVMNKLILPELLKSQFPGMDEATMNSMLVNTQIENIVGYMGDIFEIGMIIVSFTFCGALAMELKEYTLILPVCSGKRYSEIILSKLLVFGIALVAVTTVSILSNYLYSGMLFGFETDGIIPIIKAGLLQGLYMVFILSVLIFLGTLIRNQIVVGLTTLLIAYFSRLIGNLLDINEFTPAGLLTEAEKLTTGSGISVYITVAIVLALTAALTGAAILRLSRTDLTRR